MAITVSDVYIRPADTNDPLGYIEQIRGGWITVADSASMAAIPFERAKDGQIVYLQDEKLFYIATKVAASETFDPGPPPSVVQIPASLNWTQLPFSGSFSGSFQGDGSQLTGIASSLYLTGSVGSDTINLKDDALTLTGSAGGIIVTVTDNKATFTIASPATISGSFTGDGSGLTGVGGVPGGTAGQLQYHSASAFEGAEIYYSSSGNVGIGITNPAVALHVGGDAIITGILTAQEFHTEFVSASIIYQSGSTKFGNTGDDIHSFTGSVNISGSVRATNYSGSFSGSFQGDGSNLTGIASTLALSGSTGNDLVNLKTEALTLTGSARNIDVAVTNNTATFSVSDNLQLSNVELTGSFKGAFVGTFSGSIDAVIENAVTASYVLNAVSASYAHTASYVLNAVSASYATTASYAEGYVRDGGGVKDQIALWINGDTISGSAGLTYATASNTLSVVDLVVEKASGSFSGSFFGDGSGLTGIPTSLYLSGSTGNDIIDLQTNALLITGSARGIIATVTDNTVTLSISNNAILSGSFSGSYQGRIDNAVSSSHAIQADNAISASYAVTASYVRNAVSASFASYAVSASYATTASYVAGYAQGSGVANEVTYWKDGVTVSGSQAFFISESYSGNLSVFVDGKVYSQNDGGLVSLGIADDSGSMPEVGIYNDTGGGKGVLYAGSSSGVTTGAIQIANSQLMNAYAIGTGITPNAANTLRIQPTIQVINGATGSFSGSFYGTFYGLINSASHAELADDAISSSYAVTASYVLNAVSASFASSAISASYAARALSASYATTASYALNATNAVTALTASYFTGSWIDFTPLADANAPAYRNGRLWYGAEDGALNFYNGEADITLQIGQEFYVRVFNPSTSSIANGTPVLASGSQGDRITVYPALAEDHTTGAHFDSHILGLTTHTIEGSSEGYVTAQGIVRGINTSGFNAGDIVYLETGSAGLRNTPPPFPYDIVQVGYVARSAANGFIFVEPKEPVHFNNISGLSGSGTPSNKDLWVFNAANNGWYNTHSGLELSGSFSGSFSGVIDRAISSSHAVRADIADTSITASYALRAESVEILDQNVTINGNLTVYGTSSFVNVTSSRLDVDYAFISVNVFEPAERFGGLKVYDSGALSHQATASLAWDSLHNHWVYQNSSGSTYSGGMFLSGPRNTGSLGDEPGLTKWYVARSDGGDHLNDTQIYSSASNTIVYGDLFTTGTTSGSFVGDGSGLFGVAANPAGVDKSVQFKSGSVTGGASNFFYDHTTARVGIGTASPANPLHVEGVVQSNGYIARGNYAGFSSLPDAGMYAANISFDDGFGALLITSRVDAARAIAFGTHNGTAIGERMRIKADGNVGIGITVPTQKLHVSGGALFEDTVRIINVDATNNPRLIVGRQNAESINFDVDDINSYIYMKQDSDGHLDQFIKFGFQTNSTGSHSFRWFFSDAARTSENTKMVLTSDGNLGVGTTSPAGKINVVDGSESLYFSSSLGNNFRGLNLAGTNPSIRLDGSGNTFILSALGSGLAVWDETNTTYRFNILNNGNVGIGTASPTQLLEVAGAAQVDKLYFVSSSNFITVDQDTATNMSFTLNDLQAARLHRVGSSGAVLKLEQYSTGLTADGYPAYTFLDDDDTGMFLYNTDILGFSTSGSVKMVVDAAGYVGIGTVSPSAQLHVYSTGNGELEVQRASGALFNIQAQSTLATIGTDSNHPLYLKTNAGTRVQVSTGGALRLNNYGSGTITGTAAKSLAVDSSGNVIEIDVSSNGTGVANEVAFWKDTDTVSGSQDFTWDGTTLSINGILEANEKSFVIDHPTQPGKKLVYGVLEGPEHAVYCRGKINSNVIELPEEWTGLVDQDSITVQLTSIGKHQNLYVVDIRDNKVFIKNGDLLTSKINAYYYIQGTRKDTKPLQTVRDK